MNSNPFASEIAKPEASIQNNASKFPVINDGKTWYTLIIISENLAGVLNQITNVFTRRQLNIESLNVSPSGFPGLHRYTVTCRSEASEMINLSSKSRRKLTWCSPAFTPKTRFTSWSKHSIRFPQLGSLKTTKSAKQSANTMGKSLR